MKTTISSLSLGALLLAATPALACRPSMEKVQEMKKRGLYKRQTGPSSGTIVPANIVQFTKTPVSYEADGWQAQYPAAFAVPNAQPDWLASLQKAEAAGLIPNIPQTSVASGSAVYPASANINTGDPNICGFGTGCFAADDVWQLGSDQWAVTFDDGPTTGTDEILTFLMTMKQNATHYNIGSNIITNPDLTLRTYYQNQDPVQVHTWSHHQSTSLSNEQLVAELGWTIQAIVDLTGAANNGTGPAYRPLFWRPPYGDVDMRVRAVARQVFNLTTVLWDEDSRDWCLVDGGPASCAGESQQTVESRIQSWATGDHSQGMITLEHELTNASSKAFIDSYPVIKSHGWNLDSVENHLNTTGYVLASSGIAVSSSSVLSSMVTSVSSSSSSTFTASSSTVTPSPAAVLGSTSSGATTTSAPTSTSMATHSSASRSWTQPAIASLLLSVLGTACMGIL